MTNKQNRINLSDSIGMSQRIPRPRIDKILAQATRSRLVYVIAGAGYGKTQAVYNFIEQNPDANVRWLQFNESDNVGSHFWEHLTQSIYFDNPDLAENLRKLGFPDTMARFKQFAEVLKNTEFRAYKTFIIADDFQLIHSKQILIFFERYIQLSVQGACLIIISRREPDINAVSLFAKGNAAIVTEEELCFTDDEISEFLGSRGIPLTEEKLQMISNATKGWPIALQLLSFVLKRMPDRFDFALETMKQNIFKLMEAEAYNNISKSAQKTMATFALLSDMSWAPMQLLSKNNTFLQENPQLSSFIWYDALIGDYRIHPLYVEFLRSKNDILSDMEKVTAYCQAAQMCYEHNSYMDAVYCYAKARQYDKIVEILFKYPFKLPHDTCEYFYNILEGLKPDDAENPDRSFIMLKNFFIPILLIGMEKCAEARNRTFEIIEEWEKYDTPLALNILGAGYSNLAYIEMYMCTVTHKYHAAEYLKKSVEYFKRSKLPVKQGSGSFNVPDLRSFACLVGEGAKFEEFDQFLEAARQTAVQVEETFHDMYYGYDDLVACELAYYKNELEKAKKHANEAIIKARDKKQYSIEMMAETYILRIAMNEGDYVLSKRILEQLRGHLANPHFWNRQLFYNLAVRFFYSQIGLAKASASSLVFDEKDAAYEVRIPSLELMIGVNELIALKKFDQALTVLSYSYPREPNERFYFGELFFSLMSAVSKMKTGDASGALADFKKAYDTSFKGLFEMPFIETGKNLHQLVTAASSREELGIPKEWLTKIGRKANIYAKKIVIISDLYKAETKKKDAYQLSDREQKVLLDLYHGLTREEIAENQYLSLATVKKILESIRIKLDANNVADVIRIAIKNNLISD